MKMRVPVSSQGYGRVPEGQLGFLEAGESKEFRGGNRSSRRPLFLSLGAIWVVLLLGLGSISLFLQFAFHEKSCDDLLSGFQCSPTISQFWGQYSPYFSVPSNISADVPQGCHLTFAQVLSRHGARDPTAHRSVTYAKFIEGLKKNVHSFEGKYTFLSAYSYALGADQLTAFGEQQLVNSGVKFYERYQSLTRNSTPFVRASGQERVVSSAKKFNRGYHEARLNDTASKAPDEYPDTILELSEDGVSNNTLNHNLCSAFEDANNSDSDLGYDAQQTWLSIFGPPIAARLNHDLPGAELDLPELIYMMDLCPFETVASKTGQVSPFCYLFTEQEWQEYDYFETLGKYYGYGAGNPLGPTQGVGFINELISRMTGKPVDDHTSVNQTLDRSNITFPYGDGHVLFADFSHDNDMMAMFSALGLYNSTQPLKKDTLQNANDTDGYSVSWMVPFAARAYFEKMSCSGNEEELVRVLVNDRVLPLRTCGGDALGRCTLSKFVDSLSFARSGGRWDDCFPAD